MNRLIISFICLWFLIVSSDCANVLVVFNPLALSHSMVANRTVNALRKYNHTFTFLHIPLHKNTKTLRGMVSSTNIIIDDFFTEEDTDKLTSDIDGQMFAKKWKNQFIRNAKTYFALLRTSKTTGNLCKLFQLESFKRKLQAQSFDFIILDAFGSPCIRRIPDIVNAPYIETVTLSLLPRQIWEIGCPMPISYVAHDFVTFSGWEKIEYKYRMLNVVDVFVANLLGYLNVYYYGTRHLATGNFIAYSNRDSNVSGFVVNDHPYLLPTRPTIHSIQFSLRSLQNTDSRGTMNLEKFLYLDEHFKRNNYKGLIIISMSTLSDDLPENFILAILNTIVYFDDYYFVWKYRKVFPDVKNLKTANFIPLEYLLGKRQTKLIIAHGGRSTVHEAINNAVPLIGIPQGCDHDTVLNRAGKYGSIVMLNGETLDFAILKSTVTRMLHSKNYSRAARKMKLLLLDTINPLDDASQFTNKLIQRHPQKFTKPVGHQYSIFFYFNFDSLMFVIIACVIIFLLIY